MRVEVRSAAVVMLAFVIRAAFAVMIALDRCPWPAGTLCGLPTWPDTAASMGSQEIHAGEGVGYSL